VIETFALGARGERGTYQVPVHHLPKGSYPNLCGSSEFLNAGVKQPHAEGQAR
jgi:hypothetical protein